VGSILAKNKTNFLLAILGCMVLKGRRNPSCRWRQSNG